MKRWNSRLEGKSKRKKKRWNEGKIKVYFFSLLLYLSQVDGLLGLGGTACGWDNGENWKSWKDILGLL